MRNYFATLALLIACTDPTTPTTGPRIDRIERNAEDPTAYFVHGELGRVSGPIDATALRPLLPAIATTLGIPSADLVADRADRDELGMTHMRYVEQLQGLRVVGGDVVLHVTRDGVVRSVTSTARDDAPTANARIAPDTAAQVARTAAGDVDIARPELVYVIATADRSLHLAWEVAATGRHELLIDKLYIDAVTGELVDRRPEVYTAKNRTIFDGMGQSVPVFFPPQIGSEASPPTDVAGLGAFDGTGTTYDCYKTLYNRDSWNGTGGGLASTVHVVFPTSTGGTSPNNAAWALGQMWYGDGDGMMMGQTARGLDVTAHELTHGVTSATAKLAYQNESGALNEGMSDILGGAVCEAFRDHGITANTWLIGEEIWTPNTPGDALRYMADPTKDASLYPPDLGGSRDFYADRYTGTKDNGGVHLNSGIANLAFELLTVGGSHPRQKTTFLVPGIGIAHSGAIFERALTMGYFTANTNFAQARTATEMAAKDLYGAGADVTAVSFAWAAVGIGAPPMMDNVPPTVHITAPANGATVMPGFEVDVDATDDVGVLKVELAVDGTVVGTKTAAPYTFTTDASLAAGSHTVQATAYDAFNHASDSISVTIAMTCTTKDQCGTGETCDNGMCVPDDQGNPDKGGGGGCGCESRSGGTSMFLLLLGVGVIVMRRRGAAG